MKTKHILLTALLSFFLYGEAEAKSDDNLPEKSSFEETDALITCDKIAYSPIANPADMQTFSAIKLQDKKTTQEDVDILKASYDGDIDLVRKLLDEDKEKIMLYNSDGTTPLMAASIMGYTEIVELILGKIKVGDTLRLDVGDDKGNTALHYAISGKHANIVTLLRKHGANPNAFNDDEDFPIHDALTSEHIPTIQALLKEEAGAIPVNTHVENCTGDTAVFTAGKTLNKEVISSFVPIWCKNGGLSNN